MERLFGSILHLLQDWYLSAHENQPKSALIKKHTKNDVESGQ